MAKQVWVDDGEGDSIAVIEWGFNGSKFIRRPKLVDEDKVHIGMQVLDSALLRIYNDAIKAVEKKRALNKNKVG